MAKIVITIEDDEENETVNLHFTSEPGVTKEGPWTHAQVLALTITDTIEASGGQVGGLELDSSAMQRHMSAGMN